MRKLTISDLLSLEAYAVQRDTIRREMIPYKNTRRLAIGANAMLVFENRETMQYQIQEMLRIERLFEPDEIQHELDTYNPLIPDGSNWKATLMLEYPGRDERNAALRRLAGIQNRVWTQIGTQRILAIADEDMPRENETKTSAVHFLRFELPRECISSLRNNAPLAFGIDHEHFLHTVEKISPELRRTLLADLDIEND